MLRIIVALVIAATFVSVDALVLLVSLSDCLSAMFICAAHKPSDSLSVWVGVLSACHSSSSVLQLQY